MTTPPRWRYTTRYRCRVCHRTWQLEDLLGGDDRDSLLWAVFLRRASCPRCDGIVEPVTVRIKEPASGPVAEAQP